MTIDNDEWKKEITDLCDKAQNFLDLFDPDTDYNSEKSAAGWGLFDEIRRLRSKVDMDDTGWMCEVCGAVLSSRMQFCEHENYDEHGTRMKIE